MFRHARFVFGIPAQPRHELLFEKAQIEREKSAAPRVLTCAVREVAHDRVTRNSHKKRSAPRVHFRAAHAGVLCSRA